MIVLMMSSNLIAAKDIMGIERDNRLRRLSKIAAVLLVLGVACKNHGQSTQEHKE